MAVATSTNYYSNAIVGTPQVGSDTNVYDIHTTPRFAVGYGFERSDGCKFRYSQFGAATAAGKVVSTDISESCIIASIATNTGLATDTTTAIAGETVKPGGKGSHYVEVTLTPANSQTFAGGYLAIASGTGAGYIHRIKNSTATGTPSTGRALLELFEPLAVSIDTTSDLSLIGSIYANLEATTTGTDQAAVGVTVSAPSSSQYAWVQTKGIALCLQDADASATVGTIIVASTTTAGAVAQMSTAISGTCSTSASTCAGTAAFKGPILGYLVDNGASGGNSVVYLTLE